MHTISRVTATKRKGTNPVHNRFPVIPRIITLCEKMGFTYLKRGAKVKIWKRNKYKQMVSKGALSRVGHPHLSITFQGTGKPFLPLLGWRQVPGKSKRAIVFAIPKIQNKKLLSENLLHRPQSFFHNNLPISEPTLRLHTAPSNIHHNPPSLPQLSPQLLPRGGLLKLGDQASLGEQVHDDPGEAVRHCGVERVPDVDEKALLVLPLELPEPEVLARHLDDGRVKLPAVEDGVRVVVEEEAGGGAGAEAEEGDGTGGKDWRERGEDVEIGFGEGREEEGYAVDVSRAVQEKEPGAAEGVVCLSRNF